MQKERGVFIVDAYISKQKKDPKNSMDTDLFSAGEDSQSSGESYKSIDAKPER